ncbi:MAG: hypothetical protein U5K31_12170 [Balneolaceae bacterium]|nr:hypothetical protein [Balneolaceae bacterium]
MKQSDKDPSFKELMSQSKLEMPFPDFGDEVILQIKKQEEHKKSLSRHLKVSWLSFFAGTILGIVLTIQLFQLRMEGLGISSGMIELIFQIVFSVFVILSLDLLIRFSMEIWPEELFNIKSLKIPFLNNKS